MRKLIYAQAAAGFLSAVHTVEYNLSVGGNTRRGSWVGIRIMVDLNVVAIFAVFKDKAACIADGVHCAVPFFVGAHRKFEFVCLFDMCNL